jgi:pSer/pThr/pTyr-binding forkhead associated (FHA) protein
MSSPITSVSRKHLRLRRDDRDHWSAEDLASKNGTRIDGRTLVDFNRRSAACGSRSVMFYVRFDPSIRVRNGSRCGR